MISQEVLKLILFILCKFLIGLLYSFIGMFCWNHLLYLLPSSLPTLTFFNACCVYGLLYCVAQALSFPIRSSVKVEC